MNGGRAEREGDTESEAGSRLWTVSTESDAGLELTNCEIMTWAKVGCSTDWATQAPQGNEIHFKVADFLFPRGIYFLKIFCNVLFIFKTETEHEWVWGRERGRQNLKQTPGSELSAQSPTRGSNSRVVRSWPEPKSDAQPTESPRYPTPRYVVLIFNLHLGHRLLWKCKDMLWLIPGKCS